MGKEVDYNMNCEICIYCNKCYDKPQSKCLAYNPRVCSIHKIPLVKEYDNTYVCRISDCHCILYIYKGEKKNGLQRNGFSLDFKK